MAKAGMYSSLHVDFYRTGAFWIYAEVERISPFRLQSCFAKFRKMRATKNPLLRA
jgi:hypothetical protein